MCNMKVQWQKLSFSTPSRCVPSAPADKLQQTKVREREVKEALKEQRQQKKEEKDEVRSHDAAGQPALFVVCQRLAQGVGCIAGLGRARDQSSLLCTLLP